MATIDRTGTSPHDRLATSAESCANGARAVAKREKRPIRIVVGEARQTLGMTQAEFGTAVGGSHRSAVRWDAGHATPSEGQLAELARLLLPHDRALAAEVADLAGDTLVGLGLEAPPAPPAPAPAPPAPPPPEPAIALRAEDLVDIVLLAAVELTGAAPADLRLLLRTVFRRAHDVGLTTEAAAKALEALAPAATPRKVTGRAEPKALPAPKPAQ
jgi:DNA-binding transcriptional regulator YiaG